MTSLSLARCPSPPPLYHSPLSAHYLSPSSHLLRGVPVAARRRTSPVALSDGRVLLAGDRRRFFFFLWLSSFPPSSSVPSSLLSACSSSSFSYSFAFLYPLLLFIISLLFYSLARFHFLLHPFLPPSLSSSSDLLFVHPPPLPHSSTSSFFLFLLFACPISFARPSRYPNSPPPHLVTAASCEGRETAARRLRRQGERGRETGEINIGSKGEQRSL